MTEDQLPPQGPVQATRRPARVARQLALAHHVQRALDQGLIRNRAAVARKFGFTEARLTQFLDLLYLAPDIQLEVLQMEAVDGVGPLSEHRLRRVAALVRWYDQKRCWDGSSGWKPTTVASQSRRI